jgi:hypothetical protein
MDLRLLICRSAGAENYFVDFLAINMPLRWSFILNIQYRTRDIHRMKERENAKYYLSQSHRGAKES